MLQLSNPKIAQTTYLLFRVNLLLEVFSLCIYIYFLLGLFHLPAINPKMQLSYLYV